MTDPYYQDEAVTIYHGDCRDLLPDLSADAVVTDPPYGMGLYKSDISVVSPLLLRGLVEAFGTVLMFGWPEWLAGLIAATGLIPTEWITWWPTNAGPKAFINHGGLRREAECVAVFGPHRGADLCQLRSESSKRVLRRNYVRRVLRRNYVRRKPGRVAGLGDGDPLTRKVGDVWTDAAPGIAFHAHLRQHPNEKPLSLMVRLVEMTEGTVLDPFAGSGTTLRATKNLGRKAIGIEIEERYCEIAAKRCAQEVLAL